MNALSWRLWLEDKVSLTELYNMSLDDVDQASRALDAWKAAEKELRRIGKP